MVDIKDYFGTGTFLTIGGILAGAYAGKYIADAISEKVEADKADLYAAGAAIGASIAAFVVGYKSTNPNVFALMMALSGGLGAYGVYRLIKHYKPEFSIA